MYVKRRLRRSTFLLLTIGAMMGTTSSAQIIQVENAEKAIPFIATDGKEDKAIESSAVEFIDDDGRLLLVLDDERSELLVVESKTGRIKKALSLKGVDKKPKWEGLARDEEGTFYAVGSHSVKAGETDPVKLANRSRLFSFKLKLNSGKASEITIDDGSVKELNIADSLKSVGYSSAIIANIVKVEGLAVRSQFNPDKTLLRRELIVGLREPGDPATVLSADITSPPMNSAKLNLKKLFSFNAGQNDGASMRISSIEYISSWKGFAILTSTEDAENKFHGNKLWFADDEKIIQLQAGQTSPGLIEPQEVWLFGVNGKAEGITFLPGINDSRTIQAFLVYDNDGFSNSSLQKMLLARWTN